MKLLKSCADGNLTEIQTILNPSKGRKWKLRERDNHNWTCLHHAVKAGNANCVRHLLQFKDLETTAETYEGETALLLACSLPNASLEIVELLLDANADLVNFVNNEEVDPIQYAITSRRLDIVKALVGRGAPVNHQDLDGDTALHIAARLAEYNVIRYLLYETDIDPKICNEKGNTAAFLLFIVLLAVIPISILDSEGLMVDNDCFEELVQFTYDQIAPAKHHVLEIFTLMQYCFNYSSNCDVRKLFTVIVDSLPSKTYFVQKILQRNLCSDYSLIAYMHETDVELSVDCIPLHSILLRDLYILFLTDEAFFDEYISELMSTGFTFDIHCQTSAFCDQLAASRSGRLFYFLKSLILYDIPFTEFMRQCYVYLPKELADNLVCNVFAPLTSYDNVPLGLFSTLNHVEDMTSYVYNFNESENVFNDVQRLEESWLHAFEPVSLKNLCRMSIRGHLFRSHSHYKALAAIYSLELPNQLRNFLCYNFPNFKF